MFYIKQLIINELEQIFKDNTYVDQTLNLNKITNL